MAFSPYYLWKDMYNLLGFMLFLIGVYLIPYFLGDPEIYIEANNLMSPAHIVPE